MKRIKTFTILVALLFGAPVFAQMGGHGGGFDYPDSLESITVEGTVSVDSTTFHAMYYLDENDDGTNDYKLSFGPYWYTPDSSDAVRPEDGEVVSITGYKGYMDFDEFQSLIVTEINGSYWREPFEPFWNNTGGHAHHGGHHQDSCSGYADDWNVDDSLTSVSLSGTVIIDTTYFFDRYYINSDEDEVPDYFLNFGPYWYTPENGLTRPEDGENVDITGVASPYGQFPVVVVYTLNGETWRDSTAFGDHFGGGWIHADNDSAQSIHNPYDEGDLVTMNPGWHMGGGGHHGGGMMADSLFGRMVELFPHNIPGAQNQNVFAGFEVGMYFPDGHNGMRPGGNCGGMMNFGSESNIQMHYNDIQLQGYLVDENSITAKYWDSENNAWVEVSDAEIDKETNTVSFSTDNVSNYVVLTADKTTSVENEDVTIAKDFKLKQNYPNPFNPSTVIEFTLEKKNSVELNLYNAIGQKIRTLFDKSVSAGNHQYNFDASGLSSGIYFYELKVDGKNVVKKMNLLK